MKIHFSKNNVLIFGLVALLVTALSFFCIPPKPVKYYSNQDLVITFGPSATTNQSVEYFKTIVNPDSGEYVVANTSRTIVSLKDRNGMVIWSVDVDKYFKGMTFHTERQIESLGYIKGKVSGTHSITNQVMVDFGRCTIGIGVPNHLIQFYGSN